MARDISQVDNDRLLEEHSEMFDYKSESTNRYLVDGREDLVVIAGISIRLLQWGNVEEFARSLTNGKTPSFQIGTSGYVSGNSKLKKKTFDWDFFDLPGPPEDEETNTQLGTLLEMTFEAILDAGVNPSSIQNSSTGVFVGVAPYDIPTGTEAIIGGTVATRIAHVFGLQGPVYTVEFSNLFPFVRAVRAIKSGLCDAAIVAAAELGEGTSINADSDVGAVAIYLCRRDYDVKRCYGSVVNARFHRGDANGHKSFLEQTYKEVGSTPGVVDFLELHEVNASCIDATADFFTRKTHSKMPLPLRVAPHEEQAVGGLCQLAKTIVASHRGILLGGPSVPYASLNDTDHFRLLTRNNSWDGGLLAVDIVDPGAEHCHVILASPQKKTPQRLSTSLPILVPFSSVSRNNVEFALGCISQQNGNHEVASLLQDIARHNIKGHNFRGFSIISSSQVCMEVDETFKKRRPIWFVFTGMGSQWDGMGRDLIQFKVFKESIDTCAKALAPLGFDLYDAILNSSKGKQQGEALMASMVSIAAFHVALVDLLRWIGIEPDGMLGHSAGELGCAYGDGCLTAEETVLLAYWRVKSLLEQNYPAGSMAVVGLGMSDAQDRCPEDIDIACHNAKDNVSAAGPRDSIRDFVSKLTAQGVFSVQVETNEMAFHSRYIKSSEQRMMELLEKVIPEPRPRTRRWISTSLLEKDWANWTEHSAAYQVNNLMVPVYFEEALKQVPEDACVIEIAPHALLQPYIKKGVPASCVRIGLLDKMAKDGGIQLLCSIGRIYNAGLNPNIGKLYDLLDYPVSEQASSLSSLIRWERS